MKVTAFLNWDSAPAVLGVNKSGSTVGFAFNPDTGAWFNVSPADLSANGRVMSADRFAARFPDADLALLNPVPPEESIPKEKIYRILLTEKPTRRDKIDEILLIMATIAMFAALGFISWVLQYGTGNERAWLAGAIIAVIIIWTIVISIRKKKRREQPASDPFSSFIRERAIPVSTISSQSLAEPEPKEATQQDIFSGMSESRMAGIIAQGVALAELDQASRQQPSNTPEQKPEVNRAPAPPMPTGSITVTKEALEKFSKPALPFPVIFPTKD